MVWPLLIMGAMSLAGDSQSNKANYKAQAEESEALREANKKNTLRAAYQIGMMNVQKAQQTRALQQRKNELGEGELATLSSNDVNAAASGTIGASVDAVRSDIEMQFSRARAALSEENEADAFNFNLQLHDFVQGARDQLLFGRKPTGMSDLAMLGRAGVAMASKYVGDSMSLGLGSPSSGAAQIANGQQGFRTGMGPGR